jgi:hypothetical protein
VVTRTVTAVPPGTPTTLVIAVPWLSVAPDTTTLRAASFTASKSTRSTLWA